MDIRHHCVHRIKRHFGYWKSVAVFRPTSTYMLNIKIKYNNIKKLRNQLTVSWAEIHETACQTEYTTNWKQDCSDYRNIVKYSVLTQVNDSPRYQVVSGIQRSIISIFYVRSFNNYKKIRTNFMEKNLESYTSHHQR